ncbi:AraC family transcriptional regulator [Cytobacillus depressus]|uniref:AraC family transcriptional regulator n=1 Tax=Cytobacillus depressus TaxID=1602942 RepID=A0A6L3V2Q1_9BACI|nr:AraC family transcriptional regulator [Cytobacillus depressus]KAB2330807.1 AraC family transcriptional regulator [Cytobacillus depressus]
MEFIRVTKDFKVVGIKGSGAFVNYGTEVPALAKQLLNRSNEIPNHSGIEIALFEPKRDSNHLEGDYYAGLIVNDTLNEVPLGMDYLEVTQHFVTTRGKISNLGNLHLGLLEWEIEQGYTRNLDSYIVETYHPMEDEEEEVQIYLPIN